MAVLIDILAAGVVDSSGVALSGGQVYVYQPGTTSKVDVWQDADLSVPHANPLTLDAAGKAEVYINESVRVVIETSAGVSVADIEAVGEVASLEGDVTLGTDSADTVYVNGRIRGDLDPAIPATYQIGDETNTWKSVNLDAGITDGGAVYFDGGTTEYVKSNAAGTELQIGGFTTLVVPDPFVGPLIAPAGTKMLFYQAAAPAGWTRDTTASLNDKFVRVVTAGSPGTTGGVNAASTNIGAHEHGQHAGAAAGSNYTLAGAGLYYIDDTDGEIYTLNGAGVTNPTRVMTGVKASTTFSSGSYAYTDMMIATKDSL